MIDATNESLEKAGIADRPRTLLADAGYASEENFATLDPDDPDAYLAVRNMKHNPTRRTGRRGPLKKDARGIRSFMRRGKPAPDSEWKLICGTHNLLKLYRRALAKPDTVPFSRLAVPVAG